ncbi:MAG TPA: pilus assembly protein PilP [Smithellaceae bacterium]|nr:pilus assembly protein PilP [Smithellaceae bacterium]
MKKIKFIIFIVFSIMLGASIIIFAAEVKTSLPSSKQVSSSSAAVQQPAAQSAPLVKTSDNIYSYNPLGKPDPFRPFIEEEIAAKKRQEEKKKMTSMFPLQRMEVEKFRLVGIAGDSERRVAIVEDASQKFYPIFAGTQIGMNDGKVVEILTDRVIVEEYEARKLKRVIMKLRKN